jgi:hypothetical protein
MQNVLDRIGAERGDIRATLLREYFSLLACIDLENAPERERGQLAATMEALGKTSQDAKLDRATLEKASKDRKLAASLEKYDAEQEAIVKNHGDFYRASEERRKNDEAELRRLQLQRNAASAIHYRAVAARKDLEAAPDIEGIPLDDIFDDEISALNRAANVETPA